MDNIGVHKGMFSSKRLQTQEKLTLSLEIGKYVEGEWVKKLNNIKFQVLGPLVVRK